jgi:hypothetical protein
MDTQDFVHGIDFTAIGNQTAAEHNQLIDQAIPENDGAEDIGKGLVLVTKDSAVGVPSVPDPTVNPSYTKWERYIWTRKPNDADTERTMRLYVWDSQTVSDVTYLQWLQVQTDISTLSNDIATALANSNNAILTANAAAITANGANTTANNALSGINNATNQTTVALANANAAQTSANQANALAAAASANATSALAAAQANKPISGIIVGTQAGQIIRTKNDNSAFEYITPQNNSVKCSYTVGKGVNGGNAVAGKNLAPFNTKDEDLGAIATLTGNKITLPPGVYKVRATITAVSVGWMQAWLVNDSTNATLIEGRVSVGASGGESVSSIAGLLIITNANGAMTVRVDIYCAQNQNNYGLGYAGNIAGTIHEVYNIIEFERIGYQAV